MESSVFPVSRAYAVLYVSCVKEALSCGRIEAGLIDTLVCLSKERMKKEIALVFLFCAIPKGNISFCVYCFF